MESEGTRNRSPCQIHDSYSRYTVLPSYDARAGATSWKLELELEPLSVTGRDRDVTGSTLISLQILLFPLHHCDIHEVERAANALEL